MEPTEYVAPGGARQMVATPVVAERLRANGWRPFAELAELAKTDPTAREHLETAQVYAAEREAEQTAREDRYAPRLTAARTAPPPQPEPDDSGAAASETAAAEAAPAGKRRSASRS
ncbi:hypothetical protein ACIO02_33925 [Streptomyces sp. NPDC087568]|uniref:hypothetical protein n=1 Tax=Streptomyces sp. NPDC087568 TaxID=3365799 RepID=UPI00380AA6CE